MIRLTSAVEDARAGLDGLHLTPTARGYSRDALQRISGLSASYDADGFETRAETTYPDRRQFRQAVELTIVLTEDADGLADFITMLAYIEAAAVPRNDPAPPFTS